MPKTITVDVDGLPVDVDAKAYKDDPEKVAGEVRAARVKLMLEPGPDFEPPTDYTGLYGKDA
jgi:hypothetical protein